MGVEGCRRAYAVHLLVLCRPSVFVHAPQRRRTVCLQDFGARDPTVGELATGFGEKTLGNYNTEHIIK